MVSLKARPLEVKRFEGNTWQIGYARPITAVLYWCSEGAVGAVKGAVSAVEISVNVAETSGLWQ